MGVSMCANINGQCTYRWRLEDDRVVENEIVATPGAELYHVESIGLQLHTAALNEHNSESQRAQRKRSHDHGYK